MNYQHTLMVRATFLTLPFLVIVRIIVDIIILFIRIIQLPSKLPVRLSSRLLPFRNSSKRDELFYGLYFNEK